jgi:teichuronic acid biosynthesis glycosyltransferase TuaC
MRFLFIANDFPNPLNPTKAVFNLYLAQALARNHEVRVISPISWVEELSARHRKCKARLPVGRSAVIDGITVHYPRYYYPPKILRRSYGWFYWQSIRNTVKREIVAGRPDAVLAYWVHPDGQAAVNAARLAGGVRSSVIVGGSDVLLITDDPARRDRVIGVLRDIDSVITVNQDLKDKIEQMAINPGKIHVWGQGVDEKIFFPGNRVEMRQKLNIASQGSVLLWVGRMVPVKGLEVLLKACSILKERGIDFRLYLVGDGPLRGQLEADCAEKNLNGTVNFMGSRQPVQLGDWYRAADLFVLSSWSEGLPNVLRESLACGTPFVASQVGGIKEIAGESNRLFPAGDAQAMADQIAASLASGEPVPSQMRPATWGESAEALVRILQSPASR